MGFLQYLPALLAVICGIVAFCFAAGSSERRGKGFLIGFILLGFVVTPFVNMILSFMYSRVDPNLWNTLSTISTAVHCLLALCTGALLITYVVARDTKSDFVKGGAIGQRGVPQVTGPQWSVPPPAKFLHKILRKREWAYLIEFMPFGAGVVLPVWLAVMYSQVWAYDQSASGIISILGIIGWLSALTVIPYTLFRDCIGGVSIGKYFTGCRVVDEKSGRPASTGQSIVRNILFLIPFFPLVELAVASVRPDSRRLGDLMAGTTVVTGPPDFIDGVLVATEVAPVQEVKKHPLDD